MYWIIDERERHRWRVTDEEWKTCAKITDKDWMKDSQKSWFQDIWHWQLSENKKNTHFTINVLKRNFRTNFLFVILYVFVVMYIKYATCIQHHQCLTDNASVIGNKREIFQCNMTHAILLNVDYWRLTAVQLITDAYTQKCASRLGYDSWEHFINLYKWKKIFQRVTSIRHVFLCNRDYWSGGGAYCFTPVRPSVRPFVTLSMHSLSG
jgi:hypothetical protein